MSRLENLELFITELEKSHYFATIMKKPILLSKSIHLALEDVSEYLRYAQQVEKTLEKEIFTIYNYRLCAQIARIFLCRDTLIRTYAATHATYPIKLLTAQQLRNCFAPKARAENLEDARFNRDYRFTSAKLLLQYAKHEFCSMSYLDAPYVLENGQAVTYNSDLLLLLYAAEALADNAEPYHFEDFVALYARASRIDEYFALPYFEFNVYGDCLKIKNVDSHVLKKANEITMETSKNS